MNHKAFRVVFLLAVSLAVLSIVVRIKDSPEVRPIPKKDHEDKLARPMACFRVYEDPLPGGTDYRGTMYKARVSESGSVFGYVPRLGSVWANREFNVEFGAPRIEQGSLRLECANGKFERAGFGLGRIDRGAVVEEYLFENNRVEQVYRFPAALSVGALRLTIPVKSDLDGPVVTHEPNSNQFTDMQFRKGGLAFCDSQGGTRLAYHSAVAIDAAGRQAELVPHYSTGEIALDIPASFMDKAEYPVLIDPWLDFAGSGSAPGISGNAVGIVAENPTMALAPGGLPFIAWSDNSAATASNPSNTDIYLKWWNGFSFEALGTSTSPGGLSQTPGQSSNPSIALDSAFSPTVAWEDDSSGAFSIFVKQWPDKGGGAAWTELAGSASGSGISATFPPSLHPSVGILTGVIPGTLVTNPTTGVVTGTPPVFVPCPVVAFDSIQEAGSQIYVYAFYPGATGVPAGWYQMGVPGGVGTDSIHRFPFDSASCTPTGAVADHPSLTIDSQGRVTVAWEDTRTGNFDIFCSRYTITNALTLLPGQFIILANNTLTAFDFFPAGDFKDVQNTGFLNPQSAKAAGVVYNVLTGQVSTTLTPSQLPSLSTDVTTATGADNFTIAWQETEALAPPNPGTSSQIYLARSAGGGAWGAIAGSLTTGGLSHTLAQASTPSVDVNGNYIGVAWADSSNGTSSIYARRFFLGVGGSGLWDQIGFQGSAFPPAFVGEFAPINGVSQSTNFSIEPVIKLDVFGDPTICWSDGSAATFDILCKTFSPNAPGIAQGIGTANPTFVTTLNQTLTDPRLGAATAVTVGGFAGTGTNVFLSSRVFSETLLPAGVSLFLQIEVQPQGQPFVNTANIIPQPLFVAPDTPTTTPAIIAATNFQGLPNANYHWQARTVDQIGRYSPWIQFPTDVNGVSFRINLGGQNNGGGGSGGNTGGNGPANTGGTNGGKSAHRSQCGLTGLEAMALLGLLRLVRRRKASSK